MEHPSPEMVRATIHMRERAAGIRGRRVFAAGRIPSKEERRLRKKVREARRRHDDRPTHQTEIDVLLAERDLEEFLQDRGRR